jgi:Ig-like domain CHU_C associated
VRGPHDMRTFSLVMAAMIGVSAASLIAEEAPLRQLSGGVNALATGCVVTVTSCGGSVSGELAAGDCTFSDGTKYDLLGFSGTVGQQITVTLEPLDVSYTKAQLYIVPPTGDASKTPAVTGPGSLKIIYTLPSSGAWGIVAATGDIFASGKYRVTLFCGSPYPGDPQNCVEQPFSCNQSFHWSVTGTSCQYAGGGWAYAPFSMRLVKGDYVGFSARSDAFDPEIAIYGAGSAPLTSGFGKRFTQPATIYFSAPVTATYLIAVSGQTAQSAGDFYVDSSCINVCTAPTIPRQPANQTVAYGATATLTVDGSVSNGNAPTFTWYEDNFSLPVGIATGTTLTIPNVTAARRFYATATNACGSTNTITATVSPLAPPRGRSVRH